MPTYVYEYTGGPQAGRTIEIVHSIKADALTRCPTTGHPIRRVPVAPMIMADDTGRAALKDNKKLEKMGFTKLQRQSDGTYERVAGKEGPRHIDPR